jgi:hypothetical protein
MDKSSFEWIVHSVLQLSAVAVGRSERWLFRVWISGPIVRCRPIRA